MHGNWVTLALCHTTYKMSGLIRNKELKIKTSKRSLLRLREERPVQRTLAQKVRKKERAMGRSREKERRIAREKTTRPRLKKDFVGYKLHRRPRVLNTQNFGAKNGKRGHRGGWWYRRMGRWGQTGKILMVRWRPKIFRRKK